MQTSHNAYIHTMYTLCVDMCCLPACTQVLLKLNTTDYPLHYVIVCHSLILHSGTTEIHVGVNIIQEYIEYHTNDIYTMLLLPVII